MDHPWKGAIKDIADWIMDEAIEPNLKFGHIAGPPASGKSAKVPLMISEVLLQHESNIKVIHVVPAFKKATAIAQRDQADPDFGAEFALALVTYTTFSTSVFAHPNGLTRLMTLSWEGLHEASHVLFSLWREPRHFILPEVDRGQSNTISIAADEDPVAFTVARVDQETGGKHAVLSFHRPHPEIEGWEVQECRRGCSPIGEIRPPLVDKYMLYIEDLSTAPNRLSGFDSVHIVTNENLLGEEFGDTVKQVTRSTLPTSMSQRQQQIGLAHRTDSLPANVFVYTKPGFLECPLPPRPMAILNGQAGGFLAALTDLPQWPRSILTLPMVLKRQFSADRVMNGVTGRMVDQELVEFNDSALGVDIKLPELARRAFHDILPLVRWDARVAFFLAQPSTTRFISLAKAWTSAMLTHGVHAFKVDLEELNDSTYAVMCSVAKEGIFGLFSNYGQAFKALGLIKNAKQMIGAAKMISYADGSFTVDADVGQEVETKCADLLDALTTTLGSIPPGHHVGTMTSDVFDEICCHLAKAFQFQVAIVEFPEGQLPKMKDLASQQPLDYTLEVHSSVTWDMVRYLDSGWVAGIYTKLDRSEDGTLTILDWNWIPRRVWSRLRAEFDQRYHDGSQNDP
ncbi:hypothetical protein FALBO_1330 [Fusarium albosuccineum]|uniref:Uncharacterized protein n=1 Tax=Fusarium albosuccineum TaxID=1237068 RepID=A0A8H4PDP5_9HYPO|nr:hypothetical protein FALBO_1330 [Fusarium albosuccineum]